MTETEMDVELKDFIKGTLVQIIEGIKEAQEATKESTAQINPSQLDKSIKTNQGYQIHNVDFDIAVTTSNDQGANARIGVLGGVFGGAAGADIKQSNENLNRIRFHVPIQYTIMRKNPDRSPAEAGDR